MTPPSPITVHWPFSRWAVGRVVALVFVYLLRDALWPFLAGMVIAYLLDPLADRAVAVGCPRGLAAGLIVLAFLVLFVGGLVVLFPALIAQVVSLAGKLPGYLDQFREFIRPLVEEIQAQLSANQLAQLSDVLRQQSLGLIAWIGRTAGSLLTRGVALVSALSVLIIMPVVAFYLIRDWDILVAEVDGLLPRRAAPVIRDQVREIDNRLSGFIRGQTLVCLFLAIWYAVGLILAGLEFGLLVGVIAGLISFIPYVGTVVGLGSGMGLAFAQFNDWVPIALVGAVFATGQLLQDFILTPRLIGDRVGLHPAWILFALMAGGSLFGFTGVLLAIPAAAALGVVVRFAIQRYRESDAYGGDGTPPPAGSAPT